jgi:hypothetical protein
MIINDAGCLREIKSTIVMAKPAFNRNKNLFTRKLDLNLRKKLVKCCMWSLALCGAGSWTLRKVNQKYLEMFEMWCWGMIEKICWTDLVRNEKLLHKVKEQKCVLYKVKEKGGRLI